MSLLIRSICGCSFFLIVAMLLGSCKQQGVSQTLEEQIELAVSQRVMPDTSKQTVPFTAPEWVEGRGPQSTVIFRNLEYYLPTAIIEKGDAETMVLEESIMNGLGKAELKGNIYEGWTNLDSICEQKLISGIIVLHEGKVVYEQYPDMLPTDRHFLASVTKSFVGTVIANLADEGMLNEQDSIAVHLSEFEGKPLGDVTIEELLRMASGINCREHVENRVSFTDPNHCFYKLLQHSALYPEPETAFEQSLMELFAEAGAIEEAGKTYDYTSANSLILSTIAERAGGKPYHELIEQYIWRKISAEADARITLSSTGVPGSYGTIMTRLRDLARYGLAFTEDAPVKIASDRYMEQLHTGDRELFRSEGGLGQRSWLKMFEGQGPEFQSYHWDVVFQDGDFCKFGLGGQGLYISPDKRLVVAFFSSNKDETRLNNVMIWLVRSLALLPQFGS